MFEIHLSRTVTAALALCSISLASAEPQPNPTLQPASAYAASDADASTLQLSDAEAIAEPDRVCMPDSGDDKPALRSDCITVLEDVAKRKGRYAATTRNKRELRSLCANQWLPRCRHKY